MLTTLLILSILNFASLLAHYIHPFDPEFVPDYNDGTASMIGFITSSAVSWLVGFGEISAPIAKLALVPIVLITFLGAGVLFHASPKIIRKHHNTVSGTTTWDIVPRPVFFVLVALVSLGAGAYRVLR